MKKTRFVCLLLAGIILLNLEIFCTYAAEKPSINLSPETILDRNNTNKGIVQNNDIDMFTEDSAENFKEKKESTNEQYESVKTELFSGINEIEEDSIEQQVMELNLFSEVKRYTNITEEKKEDNLPFYILSALILLAFCGIGFGASRILHRINLKRRKEE